MPARLLIVEDQPIMRDGLAQLLAGTPGFEVVAAVGDAVAARAGVAALRPEVVLLDLMLGQSDGLALIGELTTAQPNLKILVLSMMSEAVYAERALRAGAIGYIMKSAETTEVVLALNSVREGRVYLSGKIFVNFFRGLLRRAPDGKMAGAEGLSDRELHVFQLIGAGVPNREMATQLGISVKTVETHRENIKHKLGLRDTDELGAAARRFVDGLRG